MAWSTSRGYPVFNYGRVFLHWKTLSKIYAFIWNHPGVLMMYKCFAGGKHQLTMYTMEYSWSMSVCIYIYIYIYIYIQYMCLIVAQLCNDTRIILFTPPQLWPSVCIEVLSVNGRETIWFWFLDPTTMYKHACQQEMIHCLRTDALPWHTRLHKGMRVGGHKFARLSKSLASLTAVNDGHRGGLGGLDSDSPVG